MASVHSEETRESTLPIVSQAEHWRSIMNPLMHTDGGSDYEEMTLNTKAGSLRILVYRPSHWKPDAKHPVHLHMHGSGWVIFKPEMDNAWCRLVSENTGAVVISPDYCKAPEHSYPAAMNQCYEVLRWIADTSSNGGATLFSLDLNKVILGGFSAGGNLAFTVALKFLQEKDIAAKLVMLCSIFPVVDLTTPYEQKLERVSADCQAKSIPLPLMNLFLTADTRPKQRAEPLCSPNFAAQDWLAQLPSSIIFTAEWDSLYLEGNQFAHQLRDAGVHVVHRMYARSTHGFINRLPDEEDYNEETQNEATALAIAEMNRAFGSA
ncbi:hypothetical protein BZG36_04973 [Bifiguratus adelaidae]|uniref:Alpha/beta hydrolase fold-3 domain-containing protein n=1 Tax=Bifiguratus adelaidae TaxID=1938954 RepID=A0A261XV57_9FUNG|nr:hypothetical protein BZG36_04973 [Bifiguratus adelaidae]